MKRLVSLLLVAVMVLSVGMVSVFAENTEEKQFLYKDKFEDYIKIPEYYPEIQGGFVYYYDYDELYYHENETSGEVDWVLITALTTFPTHPWEVVRVKQIGNRLIKWLSPGIGVLPYGYAVYDVVNDKCYDMEAIRNPENFEGLDVAFEELELGLPLGDVDMDSSVSILDATEIQRYVARLIEIPYGYYSYIPALADIEDDDEMNVLDATALQMKLAKIEDKPTYNEDLVYSGPNNMDPNSEVWQQIEFEVLHNGKHEIEDCKKSDSTFVAIIKTKEQYDEIFAVYNDVYDEKFFEENWLVASVCQVTDERMVAEISELYVSYGDFMIRLDKHIVGGDGIAQPTAPPYYSFAAVSKDSVNDVKNIIWI